MPRAAASAASRRFPDRIPGSVLLVAATAAAAAQVWPRRTCTDSDPARTWTHPPADSINSNGCNNLILSGGAFRRLLLYNVLYNGYIAAPPVAARAGCRT